MTKNKNEPEISMVYNKQDNRHYIYFGEDYVCDTKEIATAYIVYNQLVQGKTRQEIFDEMGWWIKR